MPRPLPQQAQLAPMQTVTETFKWIYGMRNIILNINPSLRHLPAALIAIATMENLGLLTADKVNVVADRNKLRRCRKRKLEEISVKHIGDLKCSRGLYFDGRKDKTMTHDDDSEAHTTLLEQPGSKYIGHLTPNERSTSQKITEAILKYLNERKITTEELVALGCDGTSGNTGGKQGITRRIEEACGKPMHWFVCMLHENELPLRDLFQHSDGKTSGPQQYCSPIGKNLESCEKLPVVSFEKIPVTLPEVDGNSLSLDQLYLFNICNAVSTGKCPKYLAERSPGKNGTLKMVNGHGWGLMCNCLLVVGPGKLFCRITTRID